MLPTLTRSTSVGTSVELTASALAATWRGRSVRLFMTAVPERWVLVAGAVWTVVALRLSMIRARVAVVVGAELVRVMLGWLFAAATGLTWAKALIERK